MVLVGVSDIVFHSDKSQSRDINAILTGDLLIITAQVIVAIQMVYEEKVLSKYDAPPLQAVGLEGLYECIVAFRQSCDRFCLQLFVWFLIRERCTVAGLFGFVVLGLLLIPLYYIPGKAPFFNGDRVEDVFDAFRQMKENYIIILATVG